MWRGAETDITSILFYDVINISWIGNGRGEERV